MESKVKLSGLQKVLKMYGKINASANGKTVVWVWDYANDKPMLESEMSKEQWAASEKAKYEQIKEQLKKDIIK